jgi:putative flippase GtrA
VNPLFARLAGSRLARFVVVGGLGFLVAEGVLWLMLHVADKYTAWLVSFLCAATFTWWGNRTLTFADRKAAGRRAMVIEWLKFVAANGLGGAVNGGLYATLVTYAPEPLGTPFVALACGVLAGLLVNFTMSAVFVFRKASGE